MPINSKVMFFTVLAAFSQVSFAVDTVGELDAVQSETILIKAKAARAQASADLVTNLQKAGLKPDGQPLSTETKIVSHDEGLPVVKAVYGANGRLFAVFLYSSGVEVESRAGDVIPGEFTITQLSTSKVSVTKLGKNYTLAFSKTAPASQSQPGATTDANGFPTQPLPLNQ